MLNVLKVIAKLSDETTPNFKSRKNLYHTYAKVGLFLMNVFFALKGSKLFIIISISPITII